MTDYYTKAIWTEPAEDGRWRIIMFAIDHESGAASILDVVEAGDTERGVQTQLWMHPDCSAVMVPEWAPSAEPCGNHYIWKLWRQDRIERLVERQLALGKSPPPEEEMIVTQLEYHRNGISGLPVWVATVNYRDGYGTHRRLLVVRAPDADRLVGAVVCVVFDIARMAGGDITFGSNSWRGDHFSDVVDEAIATRLAEMT